MDRPRWGWAPKAGARDAAPVEYLYVPCTRIRCHGQPAEARRWVQALPIVKKTAQWIYYTSDSWNRARPSSAPAASAAKDSRPTPAAVVTARTGKTGAVTDTRRRDPHSRRPPPSRAGRLFFATRQAAERHLHCGEREPVRQAEPQAALIKRLRAMADAHPDRGGTAEQFIQARRRYQTALRSRPAA